MTTVHFPGYAMTATEDEVRSARQSKANPSLLRLIGATYEFKYNRVCFKGVLQNEVAKNLSTEEIGLLISDYPFGGSITRTDDTFFGEYWID